MSNIALLDGLDDVPWSKLQYAYGPATDVPVLLRDVAEGDDSVQRKAIYDLFGTIGTRAPAAEPLSRRMLAA